MTVNAAGLGVSFGPELENFIHGFEAEIVAIPEADIPEHASVSFVNHWRAQGRHAAVSIPENGRCRVALLSNIPFRQVPIAQGEAATRAVAVMMDLKNQQDRYETFLVVAVYLQAGDERVASVQAEALLQQVLRSGFRFVALGDWNLEQEHNALVDYHAGELLRRCDECWLGEPTPATGPVYRGARRRRIDFALSHLQLPAVELDHSQGPSDHLIPRYGFDLRAPLLRGGPRRRQLVLDLPEDIIAEAFDGMNHDDFELAIKQGDVNLAWTTLSDMAEDLLGDVQPDAIPRSAHWEPTEPSFRRVVGSSIERSAATGRGTCSRMASTRAK